ncbi:hypothetical protein [Sphingomonas jaspsi]|uniref:hypothetical protein n=1 Tax=Sphingomonas jaspsi TaxID=392409 RepID=UPI0004AE40B5|nr:hypothetical protein [Sphingomonas jaspsi]
MKEITVKTSGNFMLLDRTSGHEILPGVPTTVPHTDFITERLELGQLVETDEEGVTAPPAVPPADPIPTKAEAEAEAEKEAAAKAEAEKEAAAKAEAAKEPTKKAGK